MGTCWPQRYDKLFLIDVKVRVINNTPYDVYRAASQFPLGRVEVIDLRYLSRDIPLPESEEAYLFLETAGTWMCFDWAPDRFADSIARLQTACPNLTVVGPQARALREHLNGNFRIIDRLAFQSEIVPEGRAKPRVISDAWVCRQRNRAYNGEYWDGTRLSLRETFSVYHSMNCPLTCSFCFYGRNGREPPLDFRTLFEEALADDDAWIRWKAVRSLGELGLDQSRPRVEMLIEDPDFQVRFEVAKVLRQTS